MLTNLASVGALEGYLRMFDATTGGAPKAPAFSTIWFASAGVLVLAASGALAAGEGDVKSHALRASR